MTTLMIVESPNKAKKIRGYFKEFTVIATVGHFKDLPEKELGTTLAPEHKPIYEVMKGKEDFVKRLRAAANNATLIYVATDPDREGEAIAAHVVNTLGSKHRSKIARIVYQEISKRAITDAITHSRCVDWRMVAAQEARRVMDRYVGFLVSKALTEKMSQGLEQVSTRFLTAGRVQSVIVELIYDRESAIKSFIPVDHFGVAAVISHQGVEFTANWAPPLPSGELMRDRRKAEAVIANTTLLTVHNISRNDKVVPPPKPLITATFCSLMSKVLGLTTKQAMDVGQKLFEAGLITYHRTDSASVSEDFVKSVWGFAAMNKLPLPAVPRVYKAAKNAQEGHECLRVADINLISARAAGIDDVQLQIAYQCIWRISLESQLADGIDSQTLVELLNDSNDEFLAKAVQETSAGWRRVADRFIKPVANVTDNDGDDTDVATQEHTLPSLNISDELSTFNLTLQEKQTKPPAMFTEDTLREELVRRGIGRPSTYAQAFERIITMQYVSRETKRKKYSITTLGIAIVEAMKDSFSFMQYDYTAIIEDCLDDIAMGRAKYLPVITQVYNTLTQEIDGFNNADLPPASVTSMQLWQSERPHKSSVATTAKSKNSKSKSKTTSRPPVSVASADSAGHQCPTCKTGKLKISEFAQGNNAGKSFIGCSNFPSCRYFAWIQ